MKLKFAIAMLSAITTPLLAEDVRPESALTSSSTGKFEVWCKITPTSGEEVTRYLESGRETLALGKVRRADCSYKTTAELKLTVSGSEWSCPFNKQSAPTCEVAYPASSFGSFELRRKAR